MKIICTTPDFHHPLVPGSHRHYHFIKELSKRHEITWFSLAQKPIPEEAMEEMRRYTKEIYVFSIVDDHASSQSRLEKSIKRRVAIKKLCAAFTRLIENEEYDVVLFHGKILSPMLANCRLPVVIDFCDATSMRFLIQMRNEPAWRIPVILVRYIRARLVERKLLKKSRHIAFISARDRLAIVGEDSSYEVIPNAVDPEFWSAKRNEARKNTVALTGGMNYRPNENAALTLIRDVMPVLRARLERPRLLLIGRAPTKELKRTAAKHEDVTLTGFVDDVRPWMEKASVFAAPIPFASGMQNKVLEAMAMKLPVVTSPIVAQGVEIHGPGSSPVIVANDEKAFAEEIIRLLQDPEKCRELGESGRAYVKEHFSWVRSAIKFERMCEDAVAETRRGLNAGELNYGK